jgi:cytochrome c553
MIDLFLVCFRQPPTYQHSFIPSSIMHCRSPLAVIFRPLAIFFITSCSLLFFGHRLAVAETDGSEKFTDPILRKGAAIFAAECATCHGTQGEGVKDQHDSPLIGDFTVGELAKVIHDTMPKDAPEKCEGKDAEAVAAYIHEAFYSESAQIRIRPPRIGLARLTGAQLRQSLSDLYATMDGVIEPRKDRGVQGTYFDAGRWKDDKKKLQRTDSTIDFDFGREAPVKGLRAEEFYINWEGNIKVDESGKYEIVVESTCSFVMDFRKIGIPFIDNHVQSGDKTEFRQSIHLTAGRVYPFKIDFIQRKRKTELPPAKISLRWVKPHGIEEVIPTRNLVTYVGPSVFSLQANLPPDDRSYGFDRGIAVSRQWDDSVTAAALEFGEAAAEELWPRYQEKHKKDSDAQRGRLKSFLNELVSVAFRCPLDDEITQRFVEAQLSSTPDDKEAIKVVLLSCLKSPLFLYTGLDENASESQKIANRLAMVLFDSAVGDGYIRSLVSKNRLKNTDDVRRAAEHLINDYRVQAKIRATLFEWLAMGQATELTKDKERYSGFDEALAYDLYHSLGAMLDDIISSENSDYRRLFTTDWAYTTQRLEKFYGDTWKPQEETPHGTKTQPMPGERFGVLTHPYLMSRLAYHNSTSPIHRGVFLIRYVLGRSLKPPNEAFTPLSPDLHPSLTTRERVILQTKDDNCQACHIKINGLGFTLENFDAVGRYQTTERNKPIDPRGNYVSRDGQAVELSGAEDLANYLAQSEDAHQAFVSRVFQYFVKQPVAAFGEDTLDGLTRRFAEQQFSIKKLIVDIAVVASKARPK